MPHTVSILTTYFVNINPRRRCNIYFFKLSVVYPYNIQPPAED